MPDSDGKTSKQKTIAAVLRRRITEERRYLPRALLPTEPTLAKEFGVHVNTIRVVIAQLRNEGLIITEPHRGSYVRPIFPMSSITPPLLHRISAEIATGLRAPEPAPEGWDVKADPKQTDAVADEDLAFLFDLPVGTPLVRRYNLIKVDGLPRLDTTTYYPAALLAGVTYPANADSFTVLHAAGIDVLNVRGSDKVRARMPSADEAGSLGIVGNAPLLVITRRLLAGDKVVEVAREIRYPADRVELEYPFDLGSG